MFVGCQFSFKITVEHFPSCQISSNHEKQKVLECARHIALNTQNEEIIVCKKVPTLAHFLSSKKAKRLCECFEIFSTIYFEEMSVKHAVVINQSFGWMVLHFLIRVCNSWPPTFHGNRYGPFPPLVIKSLINSRIFLFVVLLYFHDQEKFLYDLFGALVTLAKTTNQTKYVSTFSEGWSFFIYQTAFDDSTSLEMMSTFSVCTKDYPKASNEVTKTVYVLQYYNMYMWPTACARRHTEDEVNLCERRCLQKICFSAESCRNREKLLFFGAVYRY